MIAAVLCSIVLVAMAISFRTMEHVSDPQGPARLALKPFLGGVVGFFAMYAIRLIEELVAQPALVVPFYQVLAVIAMVSLISLSWAFFLAARAPLTANLAEWRAHKWGEARWELYVVAALLLGAVALILAAPAETTNGRLPVVYPPAVQAAICAMMLPVFLWFGYIAHAVGNQLNVAADARARVRYIAFCLMIWLSCRLAFDVVLAARWQGWLNVGLSIDAMLSCTIAAMLLAARRRRIVEAIDRFGASYLMSSMADAMVAVDAERVVRVANRTAEALIGRDGAQLIGTLATEALHPRRWALGDPGTTLPRAAELETVRQFVEDGEERYVVSRVVPLADTLGERVGWIEILHDITEHKRAQAQLAEYSEMLEDRIAERSRALAESEERYRGLVHNLPDCLLIIRNNQVRFANPAARELWAEAIATLPGTPVDKLWACGVTARWSEARALLAEAPETPWRGEMEWQIGPNDTRLFLVTASSVRWEGESAILVVATDHTERAKLQSSLDRMRRLQALGTLSGGIAHDFNNYLTTIIGRLSLLDQMEQPGTVAKKNAERALEASEKARMLVARLMRFSRPERSGHEPTDVCALLRETEPLLQSLVREEIRLDWHLPPEPLWANVDTSAIQEILLNLAKNADDAMRDAGGVLLIAARTQADGDGETVQISVADNGPGLSPQALEHLFEPFFTTKPVGQGHGLGLALAHQIMQEHNGAIEADSHALRGATFTLTLPACPAPKAATAPADLALVEGEGQTVLVVDDDPDVRQTAIDMLKRLGYKVITAGNGREALDVVAQRQHLAAIVMDVVMPEMNGIECAHELRALDFKAPIIFITGYDPDPQRMERLGGEYVTVSKPFRLRELGSVLSEQIAAARAAA